jgi:hypothetical protein
MLREMKVGLFDRYGGSMPSGWLRQQLERFNFTFERVFPPVLDAGNLAQKYDVLRTTPFQPGQAVAAGSTVLVTHPASRRSLQRGSVASRTRRLCRR